MTRKTIQFKLPTLATDADPASLDQGGIGAWVADLDEAAPVDAVEAFAFAGPAHADNDHPAPVEAKPEGLDDIAFAVGHPSRERAQSFLRGVGRVTDCGIVLALGWQALSREWLSLPAEAAQRSLDGFEVLRCRTVFDLADLQAAMIRRNVEDALARSGRITQLSMQVATESSRVIATGF